MLSVCSLLHPLAGFYFTLFVTTWR
uniref:Uncharacterized protein n=1 Tax=Zea mays TaxID=4577 RepID=C4IZ58_MAIZE|nr:unknown [Zea mays]